MPLGTVFPRYELKLGFALQGLHGDVAVQDTGGRAMEGSDTAHRGLQARRLSCVQPL